MRHLVVVLGALVCSGTEALADAPFPSLPNAEDHVVTMVVKELARVTGERVITHHAGWSRIDHTEKGRRATSYFGHVDSIAVSVARGTPREIDHLSIIRGPDQHCSPGLDCDGFRTGERQAFLGESCQVWNVFRTREPDRIFAKLSCVTDDGIELWQRYTGNHGVSRSMEATKVERRSVLPSEVLPPADLLSLKSWMDPVEPMPSGSLLLAANDFEVVMEAMRDDLSGRRKVTRTVRQHAPWIYTEDVGAIRDGWRTVSIHNEASRVHVRFESAATGDFKRLAISKSPPGDGSPSPKPPTDGRVEIILGERCQWFDMTPGMMDAGLSQCKTPDGIVLNELNWSRSGEQRLVAVRVQRRAVALSEVLPPSAVLARKSWGLPE
jgi:hypothetical protein